MIGYPSNVVNLLEIVFCFLRYVDRRINMYYTVNIDRNSFVHYTCAVSSCLHSAEGRIMPGTSTIPTILAGETGYTLSMSWKDNEDAEYTDTIKTDATVSIAEIQALVDAAQAASNASSFKVSWTTVWEGVADSSNALAQAHESVFDKMRLSFKAIATGAYDQVYVPAPLTAIILSGGVVDTANALYIAWRAAVVAVMQTGFTALNAGFVQNSKRNNSVSP